MVAAIESERRTAAERVGALERNLADAQREAARAALDFGHAAGLPRIIAVARESNEASRQVMEDIGMLPAGGFTHKGHAMVVYESLMAV